MKVGEFLVNIKPWILKLIALVFAVPIIIAFGLGSSYAVGIHSDFDDIPATNEKELPGDCESWVYSSEDNPTNSRTNITCGWWSTQKYTDSSIFDYFNMYRNTYNTDHMGYTTFGFLEIDKSRAIAGNSLRIRVTGGYNDDGKHGLELFTKKQFLDYINYGVDPVYTDGMVGHPSIYFMNTGDGTASDPFEVSQGANRLSLYVHLPEEVSNQYSINPNDLKAADSIHVGPYNGIGGHWYSTSQCQGGGWIHMLVDSHPQGNNSYGPPYPGYSYRDLGPVFFNDLYRYYITVARYSGIATPEYSIWLDEIKFLNDPEPQNEETINTISVMLHYDTKVFEVSFGDKYMGSYKTKATYQIRYSFSPITNDNWDQATPAQIQSTSILGVDANNYGEFTKINPYRRTVWASFKLASAEDENKIVGGNTIYFAVKDVSQNPNDMRYPREDGEGRNYVNDSDSFDNFYYDREALKLIKRIDYYIVPPDSSMSKPDIVDVKIAN